MVTISRQAGAGGEEVAGLLARELAWKTLDNAQVEILLTGKGLPRPEVETWTERQPGLLHRHSAEKERYLQFLKLVSYEFARKGSCIVLGRGGQILFADVPGVVRVRIVAPREDRLARARAAAGGDESRTRQALERADNERAGFHRSLFRVNWESPGLYDLVINTRLLSPRAAADVVLKALASRDARRKEHEMRCALENLYRAQKAVVAILFEQKLPIRGLEVLTDDGTVTLRGTAQDHPSIERAGEAAASVLQPRQVNNEIEFVPKFAQIMAGVG